MTTQVITTNLRPRLFIGMDLHKNTSTLCVKTLEGQVVISRKISTDKNEVTEFIKSIKKKSDDISLALEPVSQWYYYADLIESLGVDVHLAHPLRVKAIASARIKTDKIDAAVILTAYVWYLRYSLL